MKKSILFGLFSLAFSATALAQVHIEDAWVRGTVPQQKATGAFMRLKAEKRVLATGQAVGTRIGAGRLRLYESYEEVILKKRALRTRLAAGEKPRIPKCESVTLILTPGYCDRI